MAIHSTMMVRTMSGQEAQTIPVYVNDELDSFCAHQPIASGQLHEIGPHARGWRISHRKSGLLISFTWLTMQCDRTKALEICAALERIYDGWSQIDGRHGVESEGFKGIPQAMAALCFLRLWKSGKIRMPRMYVPMYEKTVFDILGPETKI